MNVNQILEEMRWRFGNRNDLSPRLLTWLNDAYFEFLLTPRFEFYELDRSTPWVTTKSVRVYPIEVLFPGIWYIMDIRNDSFEQKLRKFDPTEIDKVVRTEGLPYRYARFAKQIELDPTPDRSYNMTTRWRVRPPQLEQGGEHLLEREWDEPLITMAVQKGWEGLEQWEKAKAQKQLTEAQLSQREDISHMETIDHEITIGVEYGRS